MIQTIFNPKQPKDISLQLVHMAMDRLQTSNLEYEESRTADLTHRSWRTSSEKQLRELGHQVGKKDEKISQAPTDVAHSRCWITAGGALVIIAIAATLIWIQCPIRACKRHPEKPQSVEINL
ncbi:unnamed protein product [Anisakis simplex]|uniref:Uncharacterized protein n=1 Tax=Anisakis simplex TaxID=6269 RepID=A0A0M3JPM9_ANISI|nr:unnamed protein product [Anisakis simplex]